MSDWVQQIQSNVQMHYMFIAVPRLCVTAILCGMIGYEREMHVSRPAGARTHVLVGVSSAFIMVASEFMLRYYHDIGQLDPTRMGAQVISGIGFLGAGTIIKEGANVKGLTTAASLWAAACIGLAVGSGFYSGGVVVTLIILITLRALKIVMDKRAQYKLLLVTCSSGTDNLGRIKQELMSSHIYIHQVEVISISKDKGNQYAFHIALTSETLDVETTFYHIEQMENVRKVELT